ncbi:hypothetical protein [Azohydromonas caseinilytica]|uniref:Uncharacterized protein n=1 Tax=Azohydromonas caseinilytica TaxID=2728836 RepID=A0A848FFM4_9BURK|nr:hypothetical protein [Azohydromonas caseinilytica]NML16950.1 hypothetical protein [Azohydromonas caseinilytica]
MTLQAQDGDLQTLRGGDLIRIPGQHLCRVRRPATCASWGRAGLIQIKRAGWCVSMLAATRLERDSHPMRFHHRQLRRWAALVLLAWLFGVAMSVANACALRLSGDASAALVEHAEASSHHHNDGHDNESQANCLDFCEESSVAVSTWQAVPDLTSLAWLPTVFITLVIPAPPSLSARSVCAPPDVAAGPPIPITLRRLTL